MLYEVGILYFSYGEVDLREGGPKYMCIEFMIGLRMYTLQRLGASRMGFPRV